MDSRLRTASSKGAVSPYAASMAPSSRSRSTAWKHRALLTAEVPRNVARASAWWSGRQHDSIAVELGRVRGSAAHVPEREYDNVALLPAKNLPPGRGRARVCARAARERSRRRSTDSVSPGCTRERPGSAP